MHLRSRPVCVRIAKHPTLRVLLTSPPFKNSAQPERKGIARAEKNFLIPNASQTKREGTRGWPERGHDQHRPSNGCQISRTT